jgi:hypothetical protein
MLESRSFQEWVVFFVKVNLLLLTLLFMFVPMYPWWVPGVLCLLVHFMAPSFLRNYK